MRNKEEKCKRCGKVVDKGMGYDAIVTITTRSGKKYKEKRRVCRTCYGADGRVFFHGK